MADTDRDDEPRTFSPTPTGATRAREQGLGVGQQELDSQGDPGGDGGPIAPDRTEPFRTESGPDAPADRDGISDAAARTDPTMVGTPPNLDPHDFEDGDSPQLDWGESEPEAVHGATHTRRPVTTEAERGQGLKTRQRNKEINSGRPFDR
jgi:hypothetical protein